MHDARAKTYSYAAKWQVMCIFKVLCKDPQQQKQQHLSREEFFNLHTVKGLKWKLVIAGMHALMSINNM